MPSPSVHTTDGGSRPRHFCSRVTRYCALYRDDPIYAEMRCNVLLAFLVCTTVSVVVLIVSVLSSGREELLQLVGVLSVANESTSASLFDPLSGGGQTSQSEGNIGWASAIDNTTELTGATPPPPPIP